MALKKSRYSLLSVYLLANIYNLIIQVSIYNIRMLNGQIHILNGNLLALYIHLKLAYYFKSHLLLHIPNLILLDLYNYFILNYIFTILPHLLH